VVDQVIKELSLAPTFNMYQRILTYLTQNMEHYCLLNTPMYTL